MTASTFYSAPSSMVGGYIVYGGTRRQRGAGVFGSFRQIMAPVGRSALRGMKTFGRGALKGMKSVAKNKTVQELAKQAALKGAEIAAEVTVDALQGRNIGEAIKERGRQKVLNTIIGPDATPSISNKRNVTSKKAGVTKKRKKPRKNLKQKPKRLTSGKFLRRKLAIRKKRRGILSRAALNREDLF